MSDDRRDEAVASDPPEPLTPPPGAPPLAPDLDVIESDLADVEIALTRLDDGQYWRDESTGEPLDDAVLDERPTARRNP